MTGPTLTTSARLRIASRKVKGALDFAMALLCVWAAYANTPLGAIVREAGAWVFHVHSSAQPLLSYFRTRPGGGLWAGAPAPPPPFAALGAGDALGGMALGVLSELGPMGPAGAERVAEALRKTGLTALPATAPEPLVVRRLLDKQSRQLGSVDAAVLSIFVGEDAAHFAADRVGAKSGPLSFEALSAVLGPAFRDELAHTGRALTLGTAYGLRWPVPERYVLTSGFGWRDHPVMGGRRFHAGVDIGMPPGVEVRAALDGRVARAAEDAYNGKVVILDNAHGVTTLYCHNQQLLVHDGDSVRQGQLIALSGATGEVTGPHLHFQMDLSDVPVDPTRFRRWPDAPGQKSAEAPRDLHAPLDR